jgi:hypothetical protein
MRRQLIALAALAAVVPAAAGELRPDEARAFVAGKLFAYTCFEGTTGAGRIGADGSVSGTIRVRGTGPVRYVTLPPGTIRVQPASICASVRGISMEPCFSVEKIDNNRFRGSLAGMGFAYCDFVRRDGKVHFAQSSSPGQPTASRQRDY